MNFYKIAPAVFFTLIFAGSLAQMHHEEDVQTYTQTQETVEKREAIDIPSTKYVKYTVPSGDTSFKTYMDYRTITNEHSPQYKLQEKAWTDDEGLRRINDDYIIALGTFYADRVGDRVRITLDSGDIFTATVGDFKADVHTDATNRYTSMSNGCKNVVEFIVDAYSMDTKPKQMGDISYCDGMDGNISSIERIYEYE